MPAVSSPSRSPIAMPIAHERSACPSGWPSVMSSAYVSADTTSDRRGGAAAPGAWEGRGSTAVDGAITSGG